MIAAGARYDDDELLIAGAIRGKGVEVCQGVTVDIDIPAEAEIVIEGYLSPHEREDEGPLAEFHGYFGELWPSPVFHVTAICWRENPIFQTIIPGWNEHVYLGNVLPREPLLLNYVQHVSKNVTGLHIPPYGSGFTAIIALDKSNPGEPRNVAMAAFTAHVNIKWCIVVDPENKDEVRSFASGLKIPYPMLMDEGQRIKSSYGVWGLPATFVVGTDGRIHSRFTYVGEDEARALAETVERMVGKR
jgi:2,5-furandicarboxylate decarboxylase 1